MTYVFILLPIVIRDWAPVVSYEWHQWTAAHRWSICCMRWVATIPALVVPSVRSVVRLLVRPSVRILAMRSTSLCLSSDWGLSSTINCRQRWNRKRLTSWGEPNTCWQCGASVMAKCISMAKRATALSSTTGQELYGSSASRTFTSTARKKRSILGISANGSIIWETAHRTRTSFSETIASFVLCRELIASKQRQ